MIGKIINLNCKTCEELRRQLEWTRKLCDVLLAKNSMPQIEVEEVDIDGEQVEIDQEVLKGNKEVYGE